MGENDPIRKGREAQFDRLIREGEALCRSARLTRGDWHETCHAALIKGADRTLIDLIPFTEWRADCLFFLARLIPEGSTERATVELFRQYRPEALPDAVGTLRSLRKAYRANTLIEPHHAAAIEAARDLLEEAQEAISAGQGNMLDHAAAAVLAGAALAAALRTLAESARPPIRTRKRDGRFAPLARLVGHLARRGRIEPQEADQLTACIKIREQTQKGAFDGFDRAEVARMIETVRGLLQKTLN